MVRFLLLLAASLALVGCQTIKQTALPGRDDIRLVEYLEKDGSVAKSFYQMRTSTGWFEAERKKGVWGLSDMGRMDKMRSDQGGENGGSPGGGGGGCGG